jgi:hypothetical protein
MKYASVISLILHISSNREICNYNENFKAVASIFYCGLVVCPVSPNETGPSSLRNGSQPYEIPLATADCLARMKAGKESSKTKNATYTSLPDKPLK